MVTRGLAVGGGGLGEGQMIAKRDSGEMSVVTFQVHVNTNYGEQVWVCGSDDALGSWMPSKGVQVLTLLVLLALLVL